MAAGPEGLKGTDSASTRSLTQIQVLQGHFHPARVTSCCTEFPRGPTNTHPGKGTRSERLQGHGPHSSHPALTLLLCVTMGVPVLAVEAQGQGERAKLRNQRACQSPFLSPDQLPPHNVGQPGGGA